MTLVTRRQFASLAGSALASMAAGVACQAKEPQVGSDGRLLARPRRPTAPFTTGVRALGLGQDRDGIVAVPDGSAADAYPLLVLLHGAGGSGAGILKRLEAHVNEARIAVLSPDSRDGSWDVIRDGFGPDVRFLNRALERVFSTVPIDPARVSIGGFSDGASYALSLGLINGDLFRRVIAFSPGFVVGGAVHGRPKIFMSHGKADDVLPIDRCSRRIVPRLKGEGYDVTFREFEGGHAIPPAIAKEGLELVSEAA